MALIIRSLPRRTTPDPSPGPRVRPEKRTTKQKSFVIGLGTLLFPVFLLLLLLILEKCWPSFTPTNPGAEIETKVEEEEAKREDLFFFLFRFRAPDPNRVSNIFFVRLGTKKKIKRATHNRAVQRIR